MVALKYNFLAYRNEGKTHSRPECSNSPCKCNNLLCSIVSRTVVYDGRWTVQITILTSSSGYYGVITTYFLSFLFLFLFRARPNLSKRTSEIFRLCLVKERPARVTSPGRNNGVVFRLSLCVSLDHVCRSNSYAVNVIVNRGSSRLCRTECNTISGKQR